MNSNLASLRLEGKSFHASLLLIATLAILGAFSYKGDAYVYIIFTVILNTLLYMGFRKNSIFFDTFIGVLLWLGFWLKFTILVIFFDSKFRVATGEFDGSGAAFDRALIVSSVAALGIIVASHIRSKYIFNYPAHIDNAPDAGLLRFYTRYRKILLFGLIVLILTVSITNAYFGIYQRGSIPQTILPFGISGIYKWLMLFGMASFIAVVIKYEYLINKKTTIFGSVLLLIETSASSMSLLSRGMIINASALFYGIYKSIKVYSLSSSIRFWLLTIFLFICVFFSSVVLVNYIRIISFEDEPSVKSKVLTKNNEKVQTNISAIPDKAAKKPNQPLETPIEKPVNNIIQTKNPHTVTISLILKRTYVLLIDRWVGVEAVMAVSSYKGLGWGLWSKAWAERFDYNKMSFYDENLILSPYRNTDTDKHHFISLPGVVAFFFYPGSFTFLFIGLMLIGLMASLVEFSAFKLAGNNMILCALFAQVLAYRLSHFGYVPTQSYLLLGALFLNIFIFYFLNKVFFLKYNNHAIESAR